MSGAGDRRVTTVDVWAPAARLHQAGAVVAVEGPPRHVAGAASNPVVPVRFGPDATALVGEAFLRPIPDRRAGAG